MKNEGCSQFSVNPRTPASHWRRLLKLKRDAPSLPPSLPPNSCLQVNFRLSTWSFSIYLAADLPYFEVLKISFDLTFESIKILSSS